MKSRNKKTRKNQKRRNFELGGIGLTINVGSFKETNKKDWLEEIKKELKLPGRREIIGDEKRKMLSNTIYMQTDKNLDDLILIEVDIDKNDLEFSQRLKNYDGKKVIYKIYDKVLCDRRGNSSCDSVDMMPSEMRQNLNISNPFSSKKNKRLSQRQPLSVRKTLKRSLKRKNEDEDEDRENNNRNVNSSSIDSRTLKIGGKTRKRIKKKKTKSGSKTGSKTKRKKSKSPERKKRKNNEDKEECAICLEVMNKDMNDSIKTICKHVYHKECLKNLGNFNKRCPLCREDITETIEEIGPKTHVVFEGNNGLEELELLRETKEVGDRIDYITNAQSNVRIYEIVEIEGKRALKEIGDMNGLYRDQNNIIDPLDFIG